MKSLLSFHAHLIMKAGSFQVLLILDDEMIFCWRKNKQNGAEGKQKRHRLLRLQNERTPPLFKKLSEWNKVWTADRNKWDTLTIKVLGTYVLLEKSFNENESVCSQCKIGTILSGMTCDGLLLSRDLFFQRMKQEKNEQRDEEWKGKRKKKERWAREKRTDERSSSLTG